jgi:hypothetical protein
MPFFVLEANSATMKKQCRYKYTYPELRLNWFAYKVFIPLLYDMKSFSIRN